MAATAHDAPLLAVVATAKLCRPKFTPGFATVSLFSVRPAPAVTRSTTAYAGYEPGQPAVGITIAGVSAQVKKPAVKDTAADDVPVVSSDTGVRAASADHRSQNTVPAVVATAAKDTFTSW